VWRAPVVATAPPDDDRGMSFLDRSPGAFIAAVNAILYATVLTEVWMLTTGSLAAMGLVMALIIVMAGLLCRYVMDLMGSEDDLSGEEPAVAAAPVAPAAAAPARRPAAPAATARPVAG
jgi:hypothetical protein